MAELMKWGNVIEEAVNDLGLAVYPQEFECVSDQRSFLALISHATIEPIFYQGAF